MARDEPEAIAAYEKLIKINPKNAVALAQLGYASSSVGKLADAEKYLSLAGDQLLLSTTPLEKDPWSYFNDLLQHLAQRRNYKRLLYYAENAIRNKISPEHNGLFYSNMGIAYNGMQKYTQAVEYFEKAKQTGQGMSVSEAFELGKLYVNMGKMDKAAIEFGIAAEQSPDNPVPHYSYALTLRFLGHHAEAFKQAKLAHTLEPKNPTFFGEYMHLLRSMCLWREFQHNYPVIEDGIARKDYVYLEAFRFSACYWGWSMPLLHKLVQLSCNEDRVPVKDQFKPRPPQPDAINKRLKVAYVSSNYRNHAQGTQMSSFFQQHDRTRFEIYAFSTLEAVTHEAIERRKIIQKQIDHWVDVETANPFDTAKKIYELGIDIVIDLCGHADHPRLKAFAYRPAPVIISFLGYPGTTGADFVDYYIGDPTSTPPSMQPYFSEKLIYMPATYQITEHKKDHPITPENSIAKDVNPKQIVFANFNQPVKIGLDEFTIWMNLLRRVPGSIMWLLDMASKDGILAEAKTQGIDPSRLVFQKSLPKEQHLKRMANADLLLDNFNYNAHTSAGDALWAGLPIITLPGDTMPSRVCASFIVSAGFSDEMIATSPADYEEKAYELVMNPEKLKDLKVRLLEARKTAPAFDTEKYARDFEKALRETWRLYNMGSPPTSFRVTDIRDEQ